MLRFLTAFLLLAAFNTYAQIDQRKLDSLSKSVDSTAKAYKHQQSIIIKTQDSLYQSSIRQQQHSFNKDSLAEEKRTEANTRQKNISSMALAILLLGFVIFLLIKKRRRT